jgi:hypothetical protein
MTNEAAETPKEIDGLLEPVTDPLAEAPTRPLDYSQFPGRIHSTK